MKKQGPILYILFLIILVYGCGGNICEGELLYTGAKIKVEGNASKSDRKAIKAARRISAPQTQ
jgi:hypothetical protein